MRERKYIVRIWDIDGAFYIRVYAEDTILAHIKAVAWAKKSGFSFPCIRVIEEEGETQCQTHT